MYTFPDTGGTVISSCTLVAVAPRPERHIIVDTGVKARVYVFSDENVVMPIVARKGGFRHPALSLYKLIYNDLIVHFRYRIRQSHGFALT